VSGTAREKSPRFTYLSAFIRTILNRPPERADLLVHEPVHLHVVNARHRHIERFQLYCLRLYEAKQPVEQDGVQHGAQNILGVPAI
jgi:hypothetical protein